MQTQNRGSIGCVREAALKAVADFSGTSGKVLQIKRNGGGDWLVDIEVFEDNELIKSMNLETRSPVKDRNVYSVRMNRELELTNYTMLPHGDWLALQTQQAYE